MQLLLSKARCHYRFTNDFRKKIDKFTHSAIQNKCLKLMCVSLLWNISKAVKQSIFYTVMVNEVTYLRPENICIRWVHQTFDPHEDMIEPFKKCVTQEV